MNYKYEIINYDQNTPAKVMYLDLSSETHKTELHWHREPELVYVIKGQAECPRNGETIIVNEGDFILFNSEDVHLVRPVAGTTVRLVCIQHLNICVCSASQLTALFLMFLFLRRPSRNSLRFFRKLPKQMSMTNTAHCSRLLMSIRYTTCF